MDNRYLQIVSNIKGAGLQPSDTVGGFEDFMREFSQVKGAEETPLPADNGIIKLENVESEEETNDSGIVEVMEDNVASGAYEEVKDLASKLLH